MTKHWYLKSSCEHVLCHLQRQRIVGISLNFCLVHQYFSQTKRYISRQIILIANHHIIDNFILKNPICPNYLMKQF